MQNLRPPRREVLLLRIGWRGLILASSNNHIRVLLLHQFPGYLAIVMDSLVLGLIRLILYQAFNICPTSLKVPPSHASRFHISLCSSRQCRGCRTGASNPSHTWVPQGESPQVLAISKPTRSRGRPFSDTTPHTLAKSRSNVLLRPYRLVPVI